MGSSFGRKITVAGLDGESFSLHGDTDFSITRTIADRRKAEAVLVPQLLVHACVDLVESLHSGEVEVGSAGLLGDPFQSLPAFAGNRRAALRRGNLKREDGAVEKTNRVDQGVGALSRLHRLAERCRAAGVVTVGKNDQRLAAGLTGDPAGGENDRVVERGAPDAILLGIQVQKREILEHLNLSIEAYKERLVLRLAQNLVEKLPARAPLFGENRALAAADIHQEADGQRLSRLRRKVANRLDPAVFFEGEIVLGKVPNQLSLFIANRDQDVDHVDAGGEGGLLGPGKGTDAADGQPQRIAPGWRSGHMISMPARAGERGQPADFGEPLGPERRSFFEIGGSPREDPASIYLNRRGYDRLRRRCCRPAAGSRLRDSDDSRPRCPARRCGPRERRATRITGWRYVPRSRRRSPRRAYPRAPPSPGWFFRPRRESLPSHRARACASQSLPLCDRDCVAPPVKPLAATSAPKRRRSRWSTGSRFSRSWLCRRGWCSPALDAASDCKPRDTVSCAPEIERDRRSGWRSAAGRRRPKRWTEIPRAGRECG